MKTITYHITNLGSFGIGVEADVDGFVTIHDSPEYKRYTEFQLEELLDSTDRRIRMAAATELAERKIRKWQGSIQ